MIEKFKKNAKISQIIEIQNEFQLYMKKCIVLKEMLISDNDSKFE